jgi:hypothetical protein
MIVFPVRSAEPFSGNSQRHFIIPTSEEDFFFQFSIKILILQLLLYYLKCTAIEARVYIKEHRVVPTESIYNS